MDNSYGEDLSLRGTSKPALKDEERYSRHQTCIHALCLTMERASSSSAAQASPSQSRPGFAMSNYCQSSSEA